MIEKWIPPPAGPARVTFARWQLVAYPLLAAVLFVLMGVGLRLALAQLGLGRDSLAAAMASFVANLILFGGITLALAVWPGKITWAEMGIAPPRWRWTWLLIALAVSVVLLPVRMVIGAVVQLLIGGGLEGMQDRMALLGGTELTWPRFLVTLLGAGLLAPIAEELFFRGFLYTALRQRLSIAAAVLISATIFGLGHADALGVVAASWIMGVALALFYEYTRSLWVPILVHAANNAFAVILSFVLMWGLRQMGISV